MAAATGPAAFALGRGRWRDGVLIAGICVAISILLFIASELAWRAIEGTRAEAAARRVVGRVYAYDAARANPKGFVDFWDRHLEQMKKVSWVMADPRGLNPYVLRPGAKGMLHDSEVRINRLGFRGREISVDKGDRFRIVALGESTTFGVTVEPGDRPWPEVLEDRIRRGFSCDAPVEVINAGVPGWTLANQLSRMEYDILPLRPDLILSYHGYNGFPWFFGNLPGLPFLPPPQVPPRPSRLLERAEKAWRLRDLRARYARGLDRSVLNVDVSTTPYADEYRSLIRLAGSSGTLLALATFNLAVNREQSGRGRRLLRSVLSRGEERDHREPAAYAAAPPAAEAARRPLHRYRAGSGRRVPRALPRPGPLHAAGPRATRRQPAGRDPRDPDHASAAPLPARRRIGSAGSSAAAVASMTPAPLGVEWGAIDVGIPGILRGRSDSSRSSSRARWWACACCCSGGARASFRSC